MPSSSLASGVVLWEEAALQTFPVPVNIANDYVMKPYFSGLRCLAAVLKPDTSVGVAAGHVLKALDHKRSVIRLCLSWGIDYTNKMRLLQFCCPEVQPLT